jgi:hypothetical protein
MFRLRATLALAILFAPIVAKGQSDPGLWRFVSPNAKALIGIDWARIRQSHEGAMIRQKWQAVAGKQMPAIPGLELLDDVDRILISSAGKNSQDDSDESPILIAIHGHFDATQVRRLFAHFGAKPQTYNSFQVYRPQGKSTKDMAYVFFDAETILFGDPASIFAALDRNQFGPPPSQPAGTPGSMAARAAQMDANYEFWLIMDAAEIISNDRIAALFQGGEWASEAQSFEGGVNLRAGLVADIAVRFSSDVTAKRVATELSRIMNLAAKDKSTGPMQNIARKLKFNADGTAIKVSLRLNEMELEETAQALAASKKAGEPSARAAVDLTPARAPVSVPPKPAVIRIEGLDEGTREIPYHDPGHP